MTRVPFPALALTVAGLIPFVVGAVISHGVTLGLPIEPYEGRWIVYFYGSIILSFMGGVLWGFAAAQGRPTGVGPLALSVLPALWAFGTLLFAIYLEPSTLRASFYLMAVGFAVTLVLDWYVQSRGLSPRWWLSFRIPVTIVVIGCFLGTATDV
ncbi:MAG: DUF3429 domain-containing protein [Pseudomonadota bacterium]